MSELSMDARAVISTWFRYGDKTEVTIGGTHAQSVLSDRADAAIKELVAGGYVTAKPFNHTGRMTYTGTDKCHNKKLWLSMTDMEAHANWSMTKPNPQATGR